MLLPTSQVFTSTDFPLQNGGRFPELDIAYETWGTLNEAGSNAILLCHGYTNMPHAAGDENGWWHHLIGPGKAIDTDQHFVVCSNMIGSAYGSTGPASMAPSSSRPYGSSFPDITTNDMVAAQLRLIEHLGIGKLVAVVGYSFGGHLTYLWGVTHPKRMRALIPVASGQRSWSASDRIADLKRRFSACPGWNDGDYYGAKDEGGITATMTEFRIETLTNYGVLRVLSDQFGEEKAKHEVKKRAVKWADEFDANSLIVLRKAAVAYDVRNEIGKIECPVLYVLASTDKLFPPDIAEDAMRRMKDASIPAQYFEIDSDYGHNAPSSDWQKWAPTLSDFVSKIPLS